MSPQGPVPLSVSLPVRDEREHESNEVACIPEPADHSNVRQIGVDNLHNYESTMSTWKPARNLNVLRCDKQHSICTIKQHDTACFIGIYYITVLKGMVEVYGATLAQNADSKAAKQKYLVYAPATHPLPVIQAKSSPSAIVKLESAKNHMEDLQILAPMFTNIWNVEVEGAAHVRGTNTLNCSSFSYLEKRQDDTSNRKIQPMSYRHNSCFEAIHNEYSKTGNVPKVLVCGPRQSGKSTFCRTLTNYFHTGGYRDPGSNAPSLPAPGLVAYLDLDAARPEFSPRGLLSLVLVKAPLLGPPMCHPSNGLPGCEIHLVRAHSYAEDRVEENVEHFLLCAKDLNHTYNVISAHKPLPLVINTPGWTKSNIFRVLESLIELCGQNVVVCMDFPGEQDPEQYGGRGYSNYARRQLKKVAGAASSLYIEHQGHARSSYCTRTLEQLAQMRDLSYFHRDVEGWSCDPTQSSLTVPLTFSGPEADIIGIVCMEGTLSVYPDLQWPFIESRTAALVQIEAEKYAEVLRKLAKTSTEGIPFITSRYPVDPSWSHALGMVYIESVAPSVDRETPGMLYVKTPLACTEKLDRALVRQTSAGTSTLVLVMNAYQQPE